MNTNDIQTNMLNGYSICFSLVGRYFRLLCYFFVSRFLELSDGFVISALSVKLTKKGSHGTYKEISVKYKVLLRHSLPMPNHKCVWRYFHQCCNQDS